MPKYEVWRKYVIEVDSPNPRKCQNSVLDRPTRGKPGEKWGPALQIAPLCGRHSV